MNQIKQPHLRTSYDILIKDLSSPKSTELEIKNGAKTNTRLVGRTYD